MSIWVPRRPLRATAILLFSALIAAGAPEREFARVDGYIRDHMGTPIVNAQVFVIGTAFSGLSDARGHYLITGIPAGPIDLRAAFVGYRPVVVHGVQVHAGLTTHQDFVLEASVTSVQDLVVQAERPLVPRDQVSSGVQIRGGRSDAGVTYVDGVPVQGGATPSTLGRSAGKSTTATNNYQDATVTTGTAGVPPAPCCYNQPTYPPHQNFNTEEYAHLRENGFRPVASAPLSTFSIDVDKASYANVRRFLNSGTLPPVDAVRLEEMINYFSYDLPEPHGDDPFSVTTEVAQAPWNADHRLVRVGIQGKRLRDGRMPASNLVFLIDVSGSMDEPDKLPLVKASLRLLVERLHEDDRVSIVVYAGNAGLVLPCTPGTQKTRILNAIDDLEAGGSTAGGAGIQLAYSIARRNFITGGNNRVILATDGDFNVGPSSEGELDRLIESERRDGISLTVLGFGTGNYADQRMESLADKGNGNYFYVDNLMEGRKVFGEELQGTLFTIAKDVKIQVEFNPAEVASYRLVGYEDRGLRDEDFNNDTVDAGELGAGHTVTALYEIIPAGSAGASRIPAVDPLKYQPAPRLSDAPRGELLTVKLRYQRPEGGASHLLTTVVRDHDRDDGGMSDDLGFAAAVTEFGMLLRHSDYRGTSSAASVLEMARAHRGDDEDGYRAEFIQLVRTWAQLSRNQGEGIGVVE